MQAIATTSPWYSARLADSGPLPLPFFTASLFSHLEWRRENGDVGGWRQVRGPHATHLPPHAHRALPVPQAPSEGDGHALLVRGVRQHAAQVSDSSTDILTAVVPCPRLLARWP